jgi:hypothetical protein
MIRRFACSEERAREAEALLERRTCELLSSAARGHANTWWCD